MKIEFVNHSSYIVETHGVRMICDPWLDGRVFNDGWALLSPTSLATEDFGSITHLWFSHEHPDHFHPPSIKKIPPDDRSRITVLFQATSDGKVLDFCRELGFKKTLSMAPGEWISLAPGVDFVCYPSWNFEDSWSYLRAPDGCVLNLNDCVIDTEDRIKEIKSLVGKVTALFTQFSIASWEGSREEMENPLEGARNMVRRVAAQANLLAAETVIPFASFIWYCHEENNQINKSFLGIEEIQASLKDSVEQRVAFLYPGDSWTAGEEHDSRSAVERYARDQASLPSRTRAKSRSVMETLLITESHGFCGKILAGSSRLKMRIHLAKKLRGYRRGRGRRWGPGDEVAALFALLTLRNEPARIFITDYGKSYLFDLPRGLRPSTFPEEECDIALSSNSLMYSFQNLWGGQTLRVNGRFRRIQPESVGPLFYFYSLASRANAGRQGVTWNSTPRDLGARLGLNRS